MFSDVHELVQLDDGATIVFGDFIAPMDLSALGGPTDAPVLHHVVQELAPDGSLAFEWSTRDALDPFASPVWVMDPVSGAYEYAHINSLSVDAEDGGWVISVRLTNQVLKVARSGPEAGQIVWRLGGPGSDLVFAGDDRDGGRSGFFGQHSARPLPGDRLLVYDNALYREARGGLDVDVEYVVTGPSRVVEYALDHEAGTATRVFEHPLAGSGATPAAGSVQRVAGGHTLIGWGDLPQEDPGSPVATEVDADGDVVMELFMGASVWSYRVWKFELP